MSVKPATPERTSCPDFLRQPLRIQQPDSPA